MAQSAPGRHYRQGIGMIEVLGMFSIEKKAEKWLRKRIWRGRERCPRCGSTNVNMKAKHPDMPHCCADCRKCFSVRTNSCMESSRPPYRKWALATHLFHTDHRGMSLMRMRRERNVTQKTAWFMLRRPREACNSEPARFAGPVEADETLIGASAPEMNSRARAIREEKFGPGTGAAGKLAVAGITDKVTKRTQFEVLPGKKCETIKMFVLDRTIPGAGIHADEASAYKGLDQNVKNVLERPERACKRRFDGKGGFPRLQAKHRTAPSIPPAAHGSTFRIAGDRIHVRKVGWMRFRGSNPYRDGVPKTGTIRMEAEEWWVSIACEVKEDETPLPDNPMVVGVYRKVGQAALSAGRILRLPKRSKLEARRRHRQRIMARRFRKGRKCQTRRHLLTRRRAAKAARALAVIRSDWAHRTSRRMADRAVVVVLENRRTRNMIKSARGTADEPGTKVARNQGLNRSMPASAWGAPERCPECKTRAVKAGPRNTNRTCSRCGYADEKNRRSLADCPCLACAHTNDADVNAALNMLERGTARLNGEAASSDGRRTVDFMEREAA